MKFIFNKSEKLVRLGMPYYFAIFHTNKLTFPDISKYYDYYTKLDPITISKNITKDIMDPNKNKNPVLFFNSLYISIPVYNRKRPCMELLRRSFYDGVFSYGFSEFRMFNGIRVWCSVRDVNYSRNMGELNPSNDLEEIVNFLRFFKLNTKNKIDNYSQNKSKPGKLSLYFCILSRELYIKKGIIKNEINI